MTKHRLCVAVLLVFAASLASLAGDDKDKDKKQIKDAERLLGVWIMVKGEVGDRSIVDASEPLDEWTFDKDSIIAKHRGKTYAKNRLNYEIDPKATPRNIDLEFDGKKIFLGIYEFDGDHLRICYNMKKRPRQFASDEDSDPRSVLMEFKKK